MHNVAMLQDVAEAMRDYREARLHAIVTLSGFIKEIHERHGKSLDDIDCYLAQNPFAYIGIDLTADITIDAMDVARKSLEPV